jgi:hypothetical protein
MVPRVQVSADTIQFMKEVTHRKSRGDLKAVRSRGLWKCFFTGSNTSCHQHICQHYRVYQQWCKKMDIPENTQAIPPEVLRGREETKKNVKKQVTLDGMMDSIKWPTEFGREALLHAVTQLVACDNQVCFSRFECTNNADRLWVVALSLALVDKAVFQNCLVVMRPKTLKMDLPSTHDVSIYLHNQYVGRLKAEN